MTRFLCRAGQSGGTLRWLLLAGCCLALFIPPAFAKSWRISDYQDTIVVTKDGSAVVHEHITLVFIGEWHGIHRTIPVDYPGPGGTNYTLFFDINGVTNGNGHKLKYETSTKKGFRDLKIFLPNAVDTSNVVDIEYVVRNGTRFFPDHDEFYWNVTGNDWPVPIDHAAARVSFPVDAAGSLRAQAYTGVYGAAERDATTDIRHSDVLFETTNPLPMRGGLTVDIYLPKGILDEPSALTKFAWFVGSNPIVFLPLLTVGVMFTIWWYKGRDPDPGRSVAPMYEPPTGFTPAEAGTLIDDEVHPRDITSTLVDLAVRGYLKIEETVDTTMLVFHHKDYTFHLLKSRDQWDKLAPHESVMMMNVFGLDTDVKLSSLKNRFYRALPMIKQDIKGALKTKGMYRLDPDSANSYNLGGGILIVAPFVLMQYLGIRDVFNSVGLLFGVGAISVFIFWLFARQMSARTMEGARTRVAILGFQEFMNRVDADRLQRMPPDTFEKYLPYAMALGVEHNWAKAFAGLIQTPPSWYSSPNGYGGFNPLYFSNSMHSMSSDMQQTFASAPRNSSTGSGFGGSGGGGFSGGGFGGGGGSAF
jgi:hypothetical protein